MMFESFFYFTQIGGPVIWILIGLSMISWMIIFWKIWELYLSQTFISENSSEIVSFSTMVKHNIKSLPQNTAKDQSLSEIDMIMSQKAMGLRYLDLIISIAPLLGLFGTVLGMIDAFSELEKSGNNIDPGQLAGGIWEALLSTAAGMMVAIPAAVALTAYEGKLEKVKMRLLAIINQQFHMN